MNKFILYSFILFSLYNCQNKHYLERIEGKQINISDSISLDQSIEDYIKPYRENINKNLDSVLAYSPKIYSKSHGEFNTAIGNMMADAVYLKTNPIFKKRTNQNIDFVLLNHGGIRSIISKGNVTTRTAFEIMPFENSVVVVKMKGSKIKDLIDYLVEMRRAHPISRLKISLDSNGDLNSAKINNQEIDYSKSYYVATNDYLYNGGDRMTFFKPNDSLYVMDYKIRNVLIDYFTEIDTLNPKIDNRFIQIQ
ncbi:MAG: 5'-nucleotidase [Bacteroidota bacterium]